MPEKRCKVIFWSGTVLLLVCCLGLLASHEPEYQNRSVSSWLFDTGVVIDNMWLPHVDEYRETNYVRAVFAVRQIGTNAIPCLLKMLAVKHSSMMVGIENRVNDFAFKTGYHTRIKFYRYELVTTRGMALRGIELLGPAAKPCVSALEAFIKRTDDEDYYTRRYACIVLCRLSPDSNILKSPGTPLFMVPKANDKPVQF